MLCHFLPCLFQCARIQKGKNKAWKMVGRVSAGRPLCLPSSSRCLFFPREGVLISGAKVLISEKFLASKSFAKTKERIADFHPPPFVQRICLVIPGASVAAAASSRAPAGWGGGRVNAQSGVFSLSVCFCASAASRSDGWPWLCVLTGLCWD